MHSYHEGKRRGEHSYQHNPNSKLIRSSRVYEWRVERATRWREDAPSNRLGNMGMYTCVHLQGYRRDRMLSAQEVSREYWEDTKATCRSLRRRENKSTTCSRERHSNRGVMGIVDQALGSLEGGRLNNTFSVPMK